MVAILLLFAVAGPLLVGADPNAQDLPGRLAPPGESGPLGTDHLGRDLFSRVAHGARLSIAVSLAALGASLALGVAAGLLAGYFKGVWDGAVSFAIEVFLAFPGIILVLAIVAIVGGGVLNAAAAVCLVTWPGYARMVRGAVLSLVGQDFVKAARISGSGDLRILWRQILPNLRGPVIIFSATNLSAIMIQLAGLSFLGFGVGSPTAEWGAMLSEARGYITTAPWLTIAPGAALVFTVIGFNLLGEGLATHLGKGKSA